MEQLFVGTSGWVYKGWAGSFYPDSLEKTGELAYYATKFNTVEINATFYRLPSVSMAQGWYQRSPAKFVFAVKGSRFITHLKKLNVDRPSIKNYFDRVKLLKEKCGPVLWQLPPNFGFNPERLASFLKMLPSKYRHTVEFRHPSWYEQEETFEVLRKHQAAHVSLSSLRMPMNLNLTADFAYIRFHGLENGAAHDYTREELRPWADHCRRCLENGVAVYAYFNNDWNTRAPLNAEVFREMVVSTKGRTSSQRRSRPGTRSSRACHGKPSRGRGRGLRRERQTRMDTDQHR
jgi:uncharacterized protein YecE (DUF72 family)